MCVGNYRLKVVVGKQGSSSQHRTDKQSAEARTGARVYLVCYSPCREGLLTARLLLSLPCISTRLAACFAPLKPW